MIRPITAAWLLGLVSTGQLQAAEASPRSRTVEIRVTLIDVEEVNSVRQNFIANIAVALRWRDEGLAHQGQDASGIPLTDIWHPSNQIINQQKLTTTFPKIAEVQPDGTVTYRQRYWGTFSQPLNLAKFPFDSQSLRLTLANVGFGAGGLRLIPSPESGIAEQFSIPDWTVTAWNFNMLELPFEAGAAKVRGVEFALEIERNTNYFKY